MLVRTYANPRAQLSGPLVCFSLNFPYSIERTVTQGVMRSELQRASSRSSVSFFVTVSQEGGEKEDRGKKRIGWQAEGRRERERRGARRRHGEARSGVRITKRRVPPTTSGPLLGVRARDHLGLICRTETPSLLGLSSFFFFRHLPSVVRLSRISFP